MRFFDVGQRAEGFIAIGQEAVGVIAIGQLALGVVAVGQLARGVFVVGQLAVGVVAIGQLAIGVYGGMGMMAITGRWLKGLGVAIWPKPEAELGLPKAIGIADVKKGQAGFVEVELDADGDELRVVHDGDPLELTLDAAERTKLREIVDSGYPHALIRIEQKEKLERSQDVGYRDAAPTTRYLDATKIVAIPRPEWQTAGFWAKAAGKSVAIGVLAAVWFLVAIIPLWNELFATKTTLLPELFGIF